MNSYTKHIIVAGILSLPLAVTDVGAQGDISACADIDNAQERLACYDRAAENGNNLPVVRLPRNTRPAPTETASEASAGQPAERRDEFGLELKQERQRDTGPDSRTYRVLAARHNDFTGWTIEFDGGGTWKQVGTDDYAIEVGETYTIRRGTFNSFMLSNANNNKKIRITRVE